MDAFWATYVDGPDQLSDPLVAPLRADLAGLPPAFLAIAECDILADCNDAFARKLEEASVPTRTVPHKVATHSFLAPISSPPPTNPTTTHHAAWTLYIPP